MNVLIGLTQPNTRCSDGFGQAIENLICGFPAIEPEAKLLQKRLKLLATAMIDSKQKRLQVADGFVKPMQIASFIFLCVQLHTR